MEEVTKNYNQSEKEIALKLRRLVLIDLYLTLVTDIMSGGEKSIETILRNAFPSIKDKDLAAGYNTTSFNSYTLAVYNGNNELFADAFNDSNYGVIDELVYLLADTVIYVNIDANSVTPKAIDPNFYVELDRSLLNNSGSYRIYNDDYLTRKHHIVEQIKPLIDLITNDTAQLYELAYMISLSFDKRRESREYNEYKYSYEDVILPPVEIDGLEIRPPFVPSANLHPLNQYVAKYPFEKVMMQIEASKNPYILALKDSAGTINVDSIISNINEDVKFFNERISNPDATYHFTGSGISSVRTFLSAKHEFGFYIYLTALSELICEDENIPLPTPGTDYIPFTRSPIDEYLLMFLASQQASVKVLNEYIKSNILLLKTVTEPKYGSVTLNIVSSTSKLQGSNNDLFKTIRGYLYLNYPNTVFNTEALVETKRINDHYSLNKDKYDGAVNSYYDDISESCNKKAIKTAFMDSRYTIEHNKSIRNKVFKRPLDEINHEPFNEILTEKAINTLVDSYLNYIKNVVGCRISEAVIRLADLHNCTIKSDDNIVQWLISEYGSPAINSNIIKPKDEVNANDIAVIFTDLVK